MSAGDRMLDASGNSILDASGNVLLDDGLGCASCCTCEDCPPTALVTLTAGTLCWTGCDTLGRTRIAGSLSGTYTLDLRDPVIFGPCKYRYDAPYAGAAEVDLYTSGNSPCLGTPVCSRTRLEITFDAVNWTLSASVYNSASPGCFCFEIGGTNYYVNLSHVKFFGGSINPAGIPFCGTTQTIPGDNQISCSSNGGYEGDCDPLGQSAGSFTAAWGGSAEVTL